MKLISEDNETKSIIDQVVRDIASSPHTRGIILFGESKSQIIGEDTLSFMVVSDSRSSSKKTITVDQRSVEVWTYSQPELEERINFQRDIVIIRILIKGKVVYAAGNTMKSLLTRAKEVFVSGPKPITHKEKEFIRLKLTKMYAEVRNTLKQQKYPEDAYYIMNRNLPEIIEDYFKLNRWWPPSPKYLMRELRNRSVNVYQLAYTFLNHTDPAYRFAAYAKIIENVLEPVGGPSNEYRSKVFYQKGRINMLMNPVYLVEALYRNLTGKPMSLSSRFDAVARFMQFLKPYRLYFIEITIFGLFVMIISLPLPFLTRYLFDSVLPHRNFAALYFIAAISAVLGLFRSILGFFQGYYVNYTTERMNYDVTFMFYRHLYDLSHSFYDEQETGQVIFRFQDALAALAGMVFAPVRSLISLGPEIQQTMVRRLVVQIIIGIRHRREAPLFGQDDPIRSGTVRRLLAG